MGEAPKGLAPARPSTMPPRDAGAATRARRGDSPALGVKAGTSGARDVLVPEPEAAEPGEVSRIRSVVRGSRYAIGAILLLQWRKDQR